MMYIYENIFKDRISAGATDFLSRKDLIRLYANIRYRKMRGAPDVSVEDMTERFSKLNKKQAVIVLENLPAFVWSEKVEYIDYTAYIEALGRLPKEERDRIVAELEEISDIPFDDFPEKGENRIEKRVFILKNMYDPFHKITYCRKMMIQTMVLDRESYSKPSYHPSEDMIKADYHDELGFLFDLLEEKIKDNSL